MNGEKTLPVTVRRKKAHPEVRATKFYLSYLDGRNHRRKRTLDLPPGAHQFQARVVYLLQAEVEFDIPTRAVEMGLAEWFNRTEGELASMLGVSK